MLSPILRLAERKEDVLIRRANYAQYQPQLRTTIPVCRMKSRQDAVTPNPLGQERESVGAREG